MRIFRRIESSSRGWKGRLLKHTCLRPLQPCVLAHMADSFVCPGATVTSATCEHSCQECPTCSAATETAEARAALKMPARGRLCNSAASSAAARSRAGVGGQKEASRSGAGRGPSPGVRPSGPTGPPARRPSGPSLGLPQPSTLQVGGVETQVSRVRLIRPCLLTPGCPRSPPARA